VRLSVGVATGTHTSPHDLVREADLELYRAKAERSGVAVAPGEDQTDEQSSRAALSDR
jgi:PleD family two-component response regulator